MQSSLLKNAAFTLCLSLAVGSLPSLAQTPPPTPAVSPAQQQRLQLMKSKGPDASLTILLVRLGGRASDRVSEVLGLFLEKQGLKNIELAKLTLPSATNADLQALADAAGAFVIAHPITTDYALYAEFNGTHETGLNELRAVVVDRSGAVVWTDLQTAQDLQRQRVGREPIEFCTLLAQRLAPQLNLNDQTAAAAKPGKMAALMTVRSGLPPATETALLPARLKEFKRVKSNATVIVFPARIGGEVNPASAIDLVKLITETWLCKAVAAKQPLLLKASLADPNEMKALWDLAREFRDYARKKPTGAEYTLYADYGFNPRQWEQGFVHFVLCDPQGEWVIVDMQNSHHPDYQTVKPTSWQGCDRLLVRRLEGFLR
jgi:hypothetical protein